MSSHDSTSFNIIDNDEAHSEKGTSASHSFQEMRTYRDPISRAHVSFLEGAKGDKWSGRFDMSDLRSALPPPSPLPRMRRSVERPDPLNSPPGVAGSTRRLTVLDLPPPGARNAPKTFHGRFDEVEGFLNHYEKLIQICNLSTGRERCQNLLPYCVPGVADFIRVSDSYLKSDWEGLKREISKWFNAEVARKRYKPIHVAAYVQKHRQEPLYNLTKWNKYYVGFKKRSGRLVSEKLMTRAKEAWYFRHGIHEDLWSKIQATLASLNPLHDPGIPYSIEDICAAADVRLKRENFDDMQEDADRFGIVHEEMPSDSDDDTDDESETDDSDREYRRRRKEKRRKAEKRRRTHKDKEGSKRRDKPEGSPEEVSTIVRQLNRLRPDDNAYPVIVFRNEQAGEPRKEDGAYVPPYARENRGETVERGMRGAPAAPRLPPPHLTDGLARLPPFPPSEPTCFGCRRPGHRVRDCEELNKLLRDNKAKRDLQSNRIVLMNDAPVRTYAGESLVQAIVRMTGADASTPASLYYDVQEPLANRVRSYFATVRENREEDSADETYMREKEWEDGDSGEEEDSGDEREGCIEEESERMVEDERGEVYRLVRASMPAVRNDRMTTENRKEIMNEPLVLRRRAESVVSVTLDGPSGLGSQQLRRSAKITLATTFQQFLYAK
ncbi:hypothetical protein BD626DRAFT_598710 [Schizophyllum amplum]|uniref:CCHC-type domain-containing protein n=1 Tax=Schizophyllum amplum TaxID=97359 RepID=A0A550CA41_9AGAR|nr:hypothetical protein BD626DRAFT_598710 [Auriculariopsis ampla]